MPKICEKSVAKGQMVLYNIYMGRKKKQGSAKVVAGAPAQPPALDPDKTRKEFEEIFNYQRKQRNNLLGVFGAGGTYKIENQEILKQLIEVPKKFDEKQDNVVRASAKLGTFVLNFKLEFEIKEDFCQAKLLLIETEHLTEENVKHITELASDINIYSPTYQQTIFQQWNVYKEEEVREKNDFLHNYLRLQEEEFLFNRELTEVLSQLYLVRMLKILDECGELGAKAKAEYQRILEMLLAKDPSLAGDATRLKILLDEIIRKHKLMPEILKHKDAAATLNGYSNPIKNMRDKNFAPTTNEKVSQPEKKKEEKKEEKKPAKKKAKTGKSKGGGKPYVLSPKAFAGGFGKGSVTFVTSKPKQVEVKVETVQPLKKGNVKKKEVVPIQKDKVRDKTEEEFLKEIFKNVEEFKEACDATKVGKKTEEIHVKDKVKNVKGEEGKIFPGA